jgi:hypothetical protein
VEQGPLAKALPGLTRIETSKVWPKENGSPTPAYRLIDLYFPDYETASAAVTTPEAGALFPSILGLATGASASCSPTSKRPNSSPALCLVKRSGTGERRVQD